MKLLLGILIAFSGIGIILVIRSITTLLHELGHAIPALLYTDDEVRILLGTYNYDETWSFSIGRLTIHYKFNLFHWRQGLCSHSRPARWQEEAWITAGGPLMSFIIIWISIGMILYLRTDSAYYVFSILALSSVIDLVLNLRRESILLTDASYDVLHTDGYMLYRQFQLRESYFNYLDIKKYCAQGKWTLAKEKARSFLKEHPDNLELLVDFFAHAKNEEDYNFLLNQINNSSEFIDSNPLIWVPLAKLYIDLGRYSVALEYLEQHLYIHWTDKTALELKRICASETGDHYEARRLAKLLED